MIEKLEAGDFYILCPDNDVPRQLDERRILWAAVGYSHDMLPRCLISALFFQRG
jgi:hypothetical protein